MYLNYFNKLNVDEVKELFNAAKTIDHEADNAYLDMWMYAKGITFDGIYDDKGSLGQRMVISSINGRGQWGGYYHFTDFTIGDGHDYTKNVMYREYMAKRFGEEYITALRSFLIEQAEAECKALTNKLGETR